MFQVEPTLVEVWRGDLVESRHRCRYAVVDTGGNVVASAGDVVAPVYARSAIKLLQAIPLIESGAAAALALDQAELAVACASHGGEPRHVATVQRLLARTGLGSADLACGVHPPGNAAAAAALWRAQGEPSALHHNCSGKHAAMLTVCRHLGEPIHDYFRPDHPQQRRVAAVLEAMLGVSLAGAPRGIDGCGLPQIGMPLAALARAMARFGAPDDLPPDRAAACRTLAAAVVAEPFMLAGSERYCTRVITACAGAVLVKTGAEGVYVGALPAAGLGIAVKVDDGAARAAEALMSHLLLVYADAGRTGAGPTGARPTGAGLTGAGLTEEARRWLHGLLPVPVLNATGRVVGRIAVLADG